MTTTNADATRADDDDANNSSSRYNNRLGMSKLACVNVKELVPLITENPFHRKGVRERPTTDSHVIGNQGMSPAVSSNPRDKLRFCTAAPLAPLPRLSRRAQSTILSSTSL